MFANPRRETVFLRGKDILNQPFTDYPLSLAATNADQLSPHNSSTSITERESSADSLVPVRAGDPSMLYRERYQIQLEGTVGVHQKKPATAQGFDIRKISGPDAKKKVHILQQRIQHNSFLYLYEIFDFEGAFYTVSEHMDISCKELVSSVATPEEVHLATIFCGVSTIQIHGWEIRTEIAGYRWTIFPCVTRNGSWCHHLFQHTSIQVWRRKDWYVALLKSQGCSLTPEGY
jgi:hypothetical protein